MAIHGVPVHRDLLVYRLADAVQAAERPVVHVCVPGIERQVLAECVARRRVELLPRDVDVGHADVGRLRLLPAHRGILDRHVPLEVGLEEMDAKSALVWKRLPQLLEDRRRMGDLPAIDATDNQRAILERSERVVAADRLLQQTAIQLSMYLRTPDGEPQLPSPEDLPDDFPEPRLPERLELRAAIDEALSRRPEIRRLEQQRKNAEVDRDLAHNQRQPAIDLTVSGAQDVGVDPMTQYYEINRSQVFVGVSVDLPVQQRVASGKIASAEANLERIRADAKLLDDRITAEVKDALSALQAARQRLEIARKHRETAIAMEEGERTRFELGDSNLMFVNQRELASGDAAILVADAYNSFHKSLADYRYALGDLQIVDVKPGKTRLKWVSRKSVTE